MRKTTLSVIAIAGLFAAGCSLIVDIDRSKINDTVDGASDTGTVTSDTGPGTDAAVDATPDVVVTPDATPDVVVTPDATPDAGVVDAAADAAIDVVVVDAATDAATDAGATDASAG